MRENIKYSYDETLFDAFELDVFSSALNFNCLVLDRIKEKYPEADIEVKFVDCFEEELTVIADEDATQADVARNVKWIVEATLEESELWVSTDEE
jgi:hypothetical protein